MPSAPPKICSHPGCRTLTLSRDGRCEKHPKPSRWEGKQRRQGTPTQRGYGSQWRKLREAIRIRDKGLCQNCLRKGRTKEGNIVDHIIPKHLGGTDDPNNLELICKDCNNVKTGKEGRAAQ